MLLEICINLTTISGKSNALDLAIPLDACSTVLTLPWILESLRDAHWSVLSIPSVGSSNRTTLRPGYTGKHYTTDEFDFTIIFRIRWPDSPFVFDLPGGTGHTVCPNISPSRIVFSKCLLIRSNSRIGIHSSPQGFGDSYQ